MLNLAFIAIHSGKPLWPKGLWFASAFIGSSSMLFTYMFIGTKRNCLHICSLVLVACCLPDLLVPLSCCLPMCSLVHVA